MINKKIVITGATGGVGSLLASGLAQKGAHIICIGRSEEKLIKHVNQIKIKMAQFGGSASYTLAEMTDEKSLKEAAKQIEVKHGKIDAWINNVGVNNHNAMGPTWEIETENWWNEVFINLNSTFLGTRTAINLMRKNNAGYIINLGGGGVQNPKRFGSAYGAAKTAIVKFTETVNLELAEEKINIKVFAFNPGFIKNDRTELLVESEVARRYMPKLEQILKHGKMSNPQDSIDLIQCLISGKADDLAGGYFFADDKNIEELILDKMKCHEQFKNVLRVL